MSSDRHDALSVQATGRVARIELDRPERHNPLSRKMLRELSAALDGLAADDTVSVVVLAGRGPSFSAGFDLDDPDGVPAFRGAREIGADHADLQERMRHLLAPWRHPKPVIAEVHGYCLAAASVLAAACDLRIVADDAQIGLTALPTGAGFLESVWARVVGPHRAKEIAFDIGTRISGPQAVAWGFANRSFPPDRLHDEVAAMAQRVARTPVEVLRLKKAAVNRAVEASGLEEAVRIGSDIDAIAHQTEAVLRMQALLADVGLRETRRRFESGQLD